MAEFATTLRASDPPIIGYIADERFKLDMRTIFPDQDDLVIKAIRAASKSLMTGDAVIPTEAQRCRGTPRNWLCLCSTGSSTSFRSASLLSE